MDSGTEGDPMQHSIPTYLLAILRRYLVGSFMSTAPCVSNGTRQIVNGHRLVQRSRAAERCRRPCAARMMSLFRWQC